MNFIWLRSLIIDECVYFWFWITVCYVKLKTVLYFYLLEKAFGKTEPVSAELSVSDHLCLVNLSETSLDYFKNVSKVTAMETDIN